MDSLILLGCGRQSRLPQFIKVAFTKRYIEIYPQTNKALLRTLARTFCSCDNKRPELTIKEQNLFRCFTNVIPQKYSSEFIHTQQNGQTYFAQSSRQFHTSGRKDALPPLIWAVVSLVSKTGAVLTGR